MVDPSPTARAQVDARIPGGGAPTSSSRVAPNARASGRSCSSVGRRRPVSSRDSVLAEMPVSAARSVSVMSRRRRWWLQPRPDSIRAYGRYSSSMRRQLCHLARKSLRLGPVMADATMTDEARIRPGLLGNALAAGARRTGAGPADRTRTRISPRDRRLGAGYGAGCRVRRGRRALARRGGLAGHRGRHRPGGPRGGLRRASRRHGLQVNCVGRGGPQRLGPEHSSSIWSRRTTRTGDAAADFYERISELGGARRHDV